ncbi:MAG: alpha/beta fold hydrolase [Acidobacteriaceae bacterium]|nr:alpha/beta fold hydrolase [Acidobacteriaceae bacterium]
MIRAFAVAFLLLLTLCGSGCSDAPLIENKPHLTRDVTLIDSTFYSAALRRRMHLRLVFPATPTDHPLPVVYLLHGAGVDYRDWANNSEIASFAAEGFLLVMPDAPGAYYINEAEKRHNEYEQYITADVRQRVAMLAPQGATDRDHTAIVGISRGGYGATTLGLKHPDLYSFIGDISGAIDFPERPFRWHHPFESKTIYRAFGPQGSPTRQQNDPQILAEHVAQATAPYVYIACGNQDLLLTPNHRLANELDQRGIPHEFHVINGAHNWNTWNAQMPLLEAALLAHLRS